MPRRLIAFAILGVLAPASLLLAQAELPRPPVQSLDRAARAAQNDILSRARAFAFRHRYRDAEQLLKGQLAQTRGPDAATLMAVLGEVYVDSGEFALAIEWLDKALGALKNDAAAHSERLEITLALVEAHSELGQTDQARKRVETALDVLRKDSPDSIAELRLLAALAKLKPDGKLRPQALAALESVEADFRARRLGADRLVAASREFAEFEVDLGDRESAVDVLRRVLPRAEDRDALEIHRRLAELEFALDRHEREKSELDAALEVAHKLKHDAPKTSEAQAAAHYELAEVERELAEFQIRRQNYDGAAEDLLASRRDYLVAIENLRKAESAPANQRESLVPEVVLLERAAEAAARLIDIPTRAHVLEMPTVIEDHRKLLADYEASLLSDDPRRGALLVSLGSLYLLDHRRDEAREKLLAALDYWSRREPPDYEMRAQTLSLLGDWALSVGQIDDAQNRFAAAAEICHQHLSASELRWSVDLSLARLAADRAEYRTALERLETILAAAGQNRLTPELHSAVLLQMGLLQKDLLRLEQAKSSCQEALRLRIAELGDDHPELVPLYLAIGGLHIAAVDPEALARTLEIASRIQGDDDPAHAAELTHQRAMVHYLRDQQNRSRAERAAARQIWQLLTVNAQAIEERTLARARHYLARLDYLDWAEQAKEFHDRAARLEATEFPGLADRWRAWQGRQAAYDADVANYVDSRRGFVGEVDAYHRDQTSGFSAKQREFTRLTDARSGLETRLQSLVAALEALDQEQTQLLAEQARLQAKLATWREQEQTLWIDTLSHAQELAQQACDALARIGLYPSLRYAAQCNLAQIFNARSTFSDDALKLQASAIAALETAVSIIEDPRAALGDEADRAEFFAQYQTGFDLLVQWHVDAGSPWRAIEYAERARARVLLDQLRLAGVAAPTGSAASDDVAQKWQARPEPLLYYHVGGEASHVFLVAPDHPIQAIELKTPADAQGASQSVTAYDIAVRVKQLRDRFGDPQLQTELLGNEAVRNELQTISSMLVPAPVVQFLRRNREAKASHTLIVPHGAIAQLPLEALVVGGNTERPFLLDHAPPFVYAPSLAVHEALADRRAAQKPGLMLATFGDPVYPALGATDSDSRLAGLPGLPASRDECKAVAASFVTAFGPRAAELQLSREATEAKLYQELARRPAYLHLAAHGIVGPEAGESLAYLALTPSDPADGAEQDGVVELREIYEHDLSACELAVLSACESNVSLPPRKGELQSLEAMPQETSFSLASAFLAAGARRVVATQWKVVDESSSQLVALYFAELVESLRRGEALNYAQAFARARQTFRERNPRWDSPVHWAPFVLLGPAADESRLQLPVTAAR